MKKMLIVITARAGSQRVKNKNFIRIAGRSLTQMAVQQGRSIVDEGYADDVVLSTDSEYLREQCMAYVTEDIGIRDVSLSGAETKSKDVILNVISLLKNNGKTYDSVLVLQPTSPLRELQDIRDAIELYSHGCDSLITACRIPGGTINGLYIKKKDGFWPLSPNHNSGVSHDKLDPIYLRNGAVFITKIESIIKNETIIGDKPQILEMPYVRSVDIDQHADLEMVREYIHKNWKKEKKCRVQNICIDYSCDNLIELLKTNDSKDILFVFPDLLKAWMYLQKPSNYSVDQWIEYNSKEVYFDGAALINRGNVIDMKKRLSCYLSTVVPPIGLIEDYIEMRISELTTDTVSRIIYLKKKKFKGDN